MIGITDSGQKIVIDGIVLNVDAAQFRSYPGSGTSWTDLSGGGNNGTLTNGPTFNSENGGAIVFDGTNDYTIVTHNTNLNASLAMTLSVWIRITSFVANMAIFGKGTQVIGSGGYDFRIDSNNELNLVKYNIVDQRITLSNALITNTWYNIVAVQSSTKVDYYVNGNNVGTFSNSSAYQTNTAEFRVARNRATIYTPSNISNIMFYNRTLTVAEILQNYNALKSRYGL
jgi:hypothetical protein